jgi:hypothetical protein
MRFELTCGFGVLFVARVKLVDVDRPVSPKRRFTAVGGPGYDGRSL